ncbi:GDP-L-fucose synthase [Magnetospirillum fulvum]|nr:GDP-L-fucose synthase [Magnetospirillum fulvum]
MSDKAFDLSGKRIWVAGHRGMVGGAVVRHLEKMGGCTVLTAGRDVVDLTRQAAVEDWMERHRPDAVVVAAARVGGIKANDTRPAEFIYENLAIETNIIHAAHRTGVAKLLFLGSSCIYPGDIAQPMREDALLTAPLEPTNQWYAIAKIAGIKMCQAYRRQYGCDYISAMPTNLYGPGDNFDLEASHVLPALLRKIHTAKTEGRQEVVIWGSGKPMREFMYVEDLADALVYLLQHYSGEDHVNVGVGSDVSIRELADIIAEVVGYQGRFVYDSTMPDGTPRKLMDSTRLSELGWRSRTPLREGVGKTYEWFLANGANLRLEVAHG